VASLWKVDDTVTHRLMDRFYTNLWKEDEKDEMPRLDALREAQLWVLRHPDSVRGATPPDEDIPARVPPYYWAAFVLSGNWR
jgi:CHAT domain-containing protein